jgi:hydrogenase-4 component F
MHDVLIALAIWTVVPIGVAWVVPGRARRGTTAAAGAIAVALVLVLGHGLAHTSAITVPGWLRLDPLAEIFALLDALLWLAAGVFTPGYFRTHVPGTPRGEQPSPAARARFERRFYAGMNAFAGTMVLAVILANLGLVWVAIEVTTVVSALLVALEGTEAAAEAAWKYVVIASMGLGIALLGTVLLDAAATHAVGTQHALSVTRLLATRHLDPVPLQLAMVLATLGYGTKMGLVPVHTWLPDAHGEAASPVSALLSGALLATSAYVILRFLEIAERSLGAGFPHAVLLAFGIASLLIAALFLLDQHDIKRMFAYSSIEHMGIIAIGASFGVGLALVGILLHVLAHGLSKAAAFFGSGAMRVKLGTKGLASLRGAGSLLPWTGPLVLAAVAALSALPPFGTFRSEFLIVEGGMASSHDVVTVILVVLVGLAFAGLAWHNARVLLAPAPEGASRNEPSVAMVLATLGCMLAVVVLGVHPPGALMALIHRASLQLQGVRR